MRRRIGLLLLALILGAGIVGWLLPAALRAVPSRYVARLPGPVQALAEREHVSALPTVASTSAAASMLLADVASAAGEPPATQIPPPPTVTPLASEAAEATQTLALPSPATPVPTILPTPTPTAPPLPAQTRLEPFYHQYQDWNNCGPATMAMALSYFGIGVSQYDVAAFLKPNPEDRNVSPDEMAAYVNAETAQAALARANGTLDGLRRLIAAGFPVIVELGLDPPGEYAWMDWYGHYLLVVAYDDARQQVWVYDSWMGTSAVPGENAHNRGRVVSYADLDRYWRQFSRHYIVLYPPARQAELNAIVGPDLDDAAMWQAALTRARDELRESQDDAYLWFNLGTALNATGQYAEAAAAFDQARNIGLPWRMLWYQFGPYEAYMQTGRYDDVLLLTEITLRDRPYFEESYYYRGLALAALGREQEARGQYERALRFNPRFEPARVALAQLGESG